MSFRFFIYLLILLAAATSGMVRYKKLTIPFRLLTILVAVTFFLEIADRICASVFHNLMPVYHISGLAEYVFFSLINYYLFKNPVLKNIILISMVVISAFAIINAFLIQPYNRVFPSNVLLPSEILYTIFSLLLFREMLLNPLQLSLSRQSIFWYNVAMLFFSATMFINLGLINYFIAHKLNNDILNIFGYSVNLVFYILIAISIFLDRKQRYLYNE